MASLPHPSAAATSAEKPEAAEIYQAFLDETSAALLGGEPEIFCRRVTLPFLMRTVDGEVVLESWDDLMADTMNVVQAMRDLRLTEYIRLVRTARYLADDTIEGWHTTYAMRSAMAVTPPYGNRMVFKNLDGAWKVSLAEHELQSRKLPLTIMRSEPGAFDARWADTAPDLPAATDQAEVIYSDFLAGLDAANRARDFDSWQAHYIFPLRFHLPQQDTVMSSAEDYRKAMFRYQCDLTVGGAPAELHRQMTFAAFLHDGRVLGYHEAFWTQDGARVLGPMKSRMILREVDGRFRAEDVSNALHNDMLISGTFDSYGAPPTLREIERRRADDDAGTPPAHKDPKP